MVSANRVNIVEYSATVSVGQAVLESMRSSFKKVRLAVVPTPPMPAPTPAQEISKVVWLKGNLVSQDGKYFPQLTLHTDANPILLETAIEQLQAAGFDEKKWNVVREESRFCLRRTNSYANPQDGYIALSGMVWEACHRTGLQYANLHT